MHMIVHRPPQSNAQENIHRHVAHLHVQHIIRTIEQLHCSIDQKRKLIDAIAEAIAAHPQHSNPS